MIKKLQAGDSTIPASGWNEMRAFIQNYSAPQDTFKNAPRNPFLISVKNTTGAALDPLSIVAITTPTHTRTGSTFANKGVEYGVEMDGVTPTGATNTIAIIQEGIQSGCIGRAIADGCSPCFIYKASNIAYKYAKPVASHSDYLEGTDDVTNIRVLWIASGTGKKEAIICLDASGEPTPEYFVINPGNDGTQTAVNDYSLYTKGSLHYIKFDTTINAWIPISGNETTPTTVTRPAGARLVICQVDAPNSAAEFHVPYFTPESNMGVLPLTSYSNPYINLGFGNRCGVALGEHEFSGKNYDYLVTGIGGNNGVKYQYEPDFIANVTADGTTGGGNFIEFYINNDLYTITFYPTYSDGANYTDIYPYDVITVKVFSSSNSATLIDYPKDYAPGTLMAFYNVPGRGWDAISTPQNLADAGFTLYEKVKTGAIT